MTKRFAISIAAGLLAIGCSSTEEPVKHQFMSNASRPPTAEEATRATQMRQSGEAASARMAEAAKAMEEAKRKTGEK